MIEKKPISKQKKAPKAMIKKTAHMSIKEKSEYLKGHKEKMKLKEATKKGHF